jgi:hypothetical protein
MKTIHIEFRTVIMKNKLKAYNLKIIRTLTILKLIIINDLLNNSKNNQKDFQVLNE